MLKHRNRLTAALAAGLGAAADHALISLPRSSCLGFWAPKREPGGDGPGGYRAGWY
jgi:hypothetical protein